MDKEKEEGLPDEKLADKQTSGVTRTVLKQGLGKKLYGWVTPEMKKVICYRYPKKYLPLDYPWHNLTFQKLRDFLTKEERDYRKGIGQLTEEEMEDIVLELKDK